jgi:hypothetical protein
MDRSRGSPPSLCLSAFAWREVLGTLTCLGCPLGPYGHFDLCMCCWGQDTPMPLYQLQSIEAACYMDCSSLLWVYFGSLAGVVVGDSSRGPWLRAGAQPDGAPCGYMGPLDSRGTSCAILRGAPWLIHNCPSYPGKPGHAVCTLNTDLC